MFFNVVNEFRRVGRKRRLYLDYVLAALLYEKVVNIAPILAGEVQSVAEKRKILAHLSGNEQYLKFSDVGHIGSDDGTLHSPQRLLHSTSIPGEITTQNTS